MGALEILFIIIINNKIKLDCRKESLTVTKKSLTVIKESLTVKKRKLRFPRYWHNNHTKPANECFIFIVLIFSVLFVVFIFYLFACLFRFFCLSVLLLLLHIF